MSILTGRETIALKSGSDEVELNVVSNYSQAYNAEVTKHTVEKDGIMTQISDHVVLGDRAINLQAIISDTTELFALIRMTKESKMETLVNWQTNGNIITLLGYATGGILAKILEALPSIFQYLEPDDVTERFMGSSRSEIANLMLGNIEFSETTEGGDDIVAQIMLVPVLIAEAKTRFITPVKSGGKVRPKSETSVKPPSPVKSMFKSFVGG